jgi:hypothetical protein
VPVFPDNRSQLPPGGDLGAAAYGLLSVASPTLPRKRRSLQVKRPLVQIFVFMRVSGAGEGIRTLDPNLGKVVLYP